MVVSTIVLHAVIGYPLSSLRQASALYPKPIRLALFATNSSLYPKPARPALFVKNSSLYPFAVTARAVDSIVNVTVLSPNEFRTSRTHRDFKAVFGGGIRSRFSGKVLEKHLHHSNKVVDWVNQEFTFEFQCRVNDVGSVLSRHSYCVSATIPVRNIAAQLTKEELLQIAKLHGMRIPRKKSVAEVKAFFDDHECSRCADHLSIFARVTPVVKEAPPVVELPSLPRKRKPRGKLIPVSAARARLERYKNRTTVIRLIAKRYRDSGRLRHASFPPKPLSEAEKHSIIHRHCKRLSPGNFVEHGCAVCGCLVQRKSLSPLSAFKDYLDLLIAPGVTRKERFSTDDAIEDMPGPVLAAGCNRVCVNCETELTNNIIPKFALARHGWIGEVPDQLLDLTYAEGIMIAKVRHNRCVVRVNSGRVRMSANAIMFSQPVLKVYHRLPPSREELSELLAFVFTGHAQPTPEEFERTPMLVRREKVLAALEWLKLNHEGYRELEISKENLMSYPERGIPVVVDYRRAKGDLSDSVPPGSTAVNETIKERGTRSGRCTFSVHGLTSEEYATASMKTIKHVALQHLTRGGRILGIGKSEKPVSMYDNVESYPGMFPWLFPYGKGGIGHSSHKFKQAEEVRKKKLLMYHDKRFQMDTYFPMVAFNHEQMKASALGSKLLVKRGKIGYISRRLRAVNPLVAENIANRMVRGEHVKPITDAEKACFGLIKDLDAVAGRVKGSVTSKKYMRNEIWSMTAFYNAPTWFLTISWSDLHHPLALYYAQTDTVYRPEIRTSDERKKLMSSNPVSAARFFRFMVEAFLNDVLGWDGYERGLFGHTNAYYGTVEQQGRLTLHLHVLLWIVNSLSPQVIRERIMAPNSTFRLRLVRYLESCHQAEFHDAEYVARSIKTRQSLDSETEDEDDRPANTAMTRPPPTQTFPRPPPSSDAPHVSLRHWNRYFKREVDELWKRSNIHRHYHSVVNQAAKDAKEDWKGEDRKKRKRAHKLLSKLTLERNGCLTKTGICRARFPREVIQESKLDASGHLNMRHIEPLMNTVNPVLTYLSRCNTDVTSLLSRTAVKAVVSYVSDYISKLSLKSYQMFASVYHVFEKEAQVEGGDVKETERARHMMRKMVNSMTAKMEIGSPMASMYLLGHPDCYSSHKFVPFGWRSYVSFVRRFWTQHMDLVIEADENEEEEDRVPIGKQDGLYVAASGVDDYRFRPAVYSNISLYEWVQCSERRPRTKQERADFEEELLVGKYLRPEWHKMAREQLDPREEEVGSENLEDDLDDDEDYFDVPGPQRSVGSSIEDGEELYSDWETDEEDNVIVDKEEKKGKATKPVFHSFVPGHPLFRSHVVTCEFSKIKTVIPNFIGGALPRADKGDRSYYCLAMLTLFKPWRSPGDVKDPVSTWDRAFREHGFTKRQLELMSNFNVRYECNDARDDHFATLKKKMAEAQAGFTAHFTHKLMGDEDEFADDFRDVDYDSREEDSDDDDDHPKGPRTRRMEAEAKQLQSIVRESGWLNACVDYLPPISSEKLKTVPRSRIDWSKIIKLQRAELIMNKLVGMPQPDKPANKKRKREGVEILPADYFDPKSRIDSGANEILVDEIVKEFSLNKEQKRAFILVASHASSPKLEPLRMYMGGMGGTGKSQVLKAIVRFFDRRNEGYRYMIVGPTGSTSAVIGGSTYHSVFKIPRESKSKNREDLNGIRNETAALAAVNDRLQGVEYLFLDEVSMISCNDFQLLATQAAKARNIHDEAFGGLSVIVAGDFAQLPPMTGPSLYSGRVGISVGDAVDVRNQNAVLGKVLWHQFNTVVILRQNMRQQHQTAEDDKLRTALTNMRYGACTPEDISFLESRIAGFGPDDPKLNSAAFRNVSVITARNSQKDTLNKLGCERFAAEYGRELVDFYSLDRISSRAVDKSKWKGCEQCPAKQINKRLQQQLWDAYPSTTSEFIPGKLSLCTGMPVMLRANDATEMCMTKGQEAIVVGWDAAIGSSGRNVLETLFVKLVNPPREVQISDLPPNVIPLSRTVTHLTVLLEDDTVLSILREQVVILLNFGMTDYTSQGKSRAQNPVDLTNCRDHRSYYVALSRGSSAEGTIILQRFDAQKITTGMSGYLRQELRELEILDEITKLKHEGKLPPSVTGIYRRRLLKSFYDWRGEKRELTHIHPAMRWDESQGPRIPTEIVYEVWRPSGSRGRKRKAPTESTALNEGSKCIKHAPIIDSQTSNTALSSQTSRRPVGFIWDAQDWSCAYDSTLTILANIWADDTARWNGLFQVMSPAMGVLNEHLQLSWAGLQTLENSRNEVRQWMYTQDQASFPYGPNMTSVDRIAQLLLPSQQHGRGRQLCGQCGFVDPVLYDVLDPYMCVTVGNSPREGGNVTVGGWIRHILSKGHGRCPLCAQNGNRRRLTMIPYLTSVPPVMIIYIHNPRLLFDRVVQFDQAGTMVRLGLRGIIYYGQNHFTCRYIDRSGDMWFNNGIETGRTCMRQANIAYFENGLDLHGCSGRDAIALVYALL